MNQQSEKTLKTDVLIIGAGATGAGIMRDLALRGIHSILIDKEDLCAGASGGNHGLLHSGARYVFKDQHSAIECRVENEILKNIAPHCIENTSGYFVAVEGDDDNYIKNFPQMCSDAGISCNPVAVEDARRNEPELSDKTIAVYEVPDATIDPFRLVLEHVGEAVTSGYGQYIPHSQATKFVIENGTITEIQCRNNQTETNFSICASQIINAGGAWAGKIAELAGSNSIDLLFSKGTLLVTNDRMNTRVINRLRPPGNGDIVVPGGTVSIVGTTSVSVEELERTKATIDEVDENVQESAVMMPSLDSTRYIRAFARIRPLVITGDSGSSRSVARSFSIFDHKDEGLHNFVSITGGKLTTFRLMAEKTVDLVAERLGNTCPCKTAIQPLNTTAACGWTEPGAAPKKWYAEDNPNDVILCECEMVPQSAIDNIVDEAPGSEENISLEAIALRSRAGKGPCQGSFCGIRIASHLYDNGHYTDQYGLESMKGFFSERFKGMRPIIWGQQMAQMELAEALHRGLLGLDSIDQEEEK